MIQTLRATIKSGVNLKNFVNLFFEEEEKKWVQILFEAKPGIWKSRKNNKLPAGTEKKERNHTIYLYTLVCSY